jgi:dTDP-4-amino-4,6-dideoxygalactose transaminase
MEVRKVLESGWLVQGDKVEEFENLIKDYLNVKHVIAVSSGTAALHLSLLSMGIKPNDEVIIPDFTFPATANVVELINANCVFVDIEPETFNIAPEKIEEKITERTKAIIVVHEFGCPAKLDEIIAIATKHDLKVLEDAACALGAEYKGKKVGTIGDIGCFSLHPRKNITTGEGGIVVTNNDEYAEKIKMLRNHGIKIIKGRTRFELAGFNYRLTNIQGAIGTVQMKKLEKIIEKKTQLIKIYEKLLSDIEWVKIPRAPEYGRHVWQTYHVMLDRNINRTKLINYLRNNGIETNYGAYSVHREPYYKRKYNFDDKEFINSIRAADFGLALPLHSKLKQSDLEYISQQISKFGSDINDL